MKKLFFLLVPLLLLVFCGCGGNMAGWPKLELNLEPQSFNEVSLEYHHIADPSPRRPLDVDEDFLGISSEEEVICAIYAQINGALYSEKSYKKIDTENYWDKVVITFSRNGAAAYTFTFYGYSVANGYFVLDNGEIHKHDGDFVGCTYGQFKDILQTVDIPLL